MCRCPKKSCGVRPVSIDRYGDTPPSWYIRRAISPISSFAAATATRALPGLDSGTVPARQHLDALVQRVRPALDALGEYDRVTEELDRVTAQGNGAMRQRKVWRERGDMMDVIADAAAATRG